MKLCETDLAKFKNTESKRLLTSIIDNLARYNHVSIEEIDKKDKELGLVWNWLNTFAKHRQIDKMIMFLQHMGLYSDNIHEALDSRVADARRATQKANQELLLQVQLMSFNDIIKQIQEKIPSAEWHQFKNANTYQGKITYETESGYAEIWFRTDGMIVCSATYDPKRVRCDSDEKIFAWIDKHPPIAQETDVEITADMIPEITSKIHAAFIAEPFEKFKNQQKVIGKQRVYSLSDNEYFDIWYRPSGEIFCKTPSDKFYKFTTLKKFERFLKLTLKKRA